MHARPRTVLCIAALACVASAQAQLDLAARDAAMKHGTVTYTAHETIDGKTYDEPTTLTYSSHGQVLERIDHAARLGGVTVTFLQDRGSSFMERKAAGDDTITVGGFLPRNDSPMFFIVEKPSLALAGGLSKLRNPQTKTVPGGLILTGKLPDTTDLRVIYGKQLKFGIPDRMERSVKGKVINAWDMTGAVAAGPNLWVPAKVVTTTPGSSRRDFDRTFTLHSANFSTEPKAADLTYNWFHPGVTIQDDSFRPPVMWTYDELVQANGGNTQLDSKTFESLSNQKNLALTTGRPRDPAAVRFQTILSLLTVCLLSVLVYRVRRTAGSRNLI